MNKTQKSAWFCLATFMLCVALLSYALIKLFLLKSLPGTFERYVLLPGYVIFTVAGVFFLRKKQSPAEVDSDERDTAIKSKAAQISFACGWILLALVSLGLEIFVGAGGMIPIWFITLINAAVFMAAMLIYNIVVLVRYSRGGKDGQR